MKSHEVLRTEARARRRRDMSIIARALTVIVGVLVLLGTYHLFIEPIRLHASPTSLYIPWIAGFVATFVCNLVWTRWWWRDEKRDKAFEMAQAGLLSLSVWFIAFVISLG